MFYITKIELKIYPSTGPAYTINMEAEKNEQLDVSNIENYIETWIDEHLINVENYDIHVTYN